MKAAQLRVLSAVPTGNTFDKYQARSPLVRHLVARFERVLGEMIGLASPSSILDVGCGEGVLTSRWAHELADASVVGLDLPDPRLQVLWDSRQRRNLRFVAGRAEQLPFERGEFELVTAIEALEHVHDADRALAEMARVASRHVIISVPREPLWRILNVARGAYVSALGNTPGHVNHFSPTALRRLLARHGRLIEMRTPLPWVVALVQTT